MSVTLSWPDIVLRLAFTVLGGLVIGFNRGEAGRPAGMRTTLLVCLAASLSMIEANLLMHTVGKTPDSFITLDLMRLPLGVLSGMGFIGAGAVLRRNDLVIGLTTAATLWFTTMMGLCFGGGQIGLGLTALGLGFGTLWGLRYVEAWIPREMRATLILAMSREGPSDDEIRQRIGKDNCVVVAWTVRLTDAGNSRELYADVHRRTRPTETRPPAFVAELAQYQAVHEVQWIPEGAASGRASLSAMKDDPPAGGGEV